MFLNALNRSESENFLELAELAMEADRVFDESEKGDY